MTIVFRHFPKVFYKTRVDYISDFLTLPFYYTDLSVRGGWGGAPAGAVSLLPPVGSRGCQAWLTAPFPTEPSTRNIVFFIINKTLLLTRIFQKG